MEESLKVIRNHAMGSLIKKYAANGQFFTNKEFEENEGKILDLGGALHRISESVLTDKNK